MLDDSERTADDLLGWLGGRPQLALVGRGSARAAAEMGALTLKEAARFPAESLQAAQFRHGPLELAGPELAVIVIATEPATRSLELGLAAELVTAGAAVLVVSQDGDTRMAPARLPPARSPAAWPPPRPPSGAAARVAPRPLDAASHPASSRSPAR